jgi:hypothetical protein
MASGTSKMTQIYVGLGLCAVLGGLYYMQRKQEKATTNTSANTASSTSMPQIKVVPEEADRIVVKAKDKPEVVLEKKGTEWTMAQPVAGAKVVKATVDELLNGLKALSFKDSIAKGQDKFASYDLLEGKGIHVVVSKGGVAVADVWFGSSAGRGQLARVANDDTVYLVGGAFGYTFDKAPKDFRDKKVWELAKDNVVGVEIKDAKGALVFAKAGPAPAPVAGDAGAAGAADAPAAAADAGPPPSWTGTFNGTAIAGLETAKIDDLVNAFAMGGTLNADDFGDGKSDAETGLAGADATTITFRLKDGGAAVITLGKTDGAMRYARKATDATIFLLGAGPATWAEVGLDKFAAPAPAGDGGVDGGGAGSEAGAAAPSPAGSASAGKK